MAEKNFKVNDLVEIDWTTRESQSMPSYRTVSYILHTILGSPPWRVIGSEIFPPANVPSIYLKSLSREAKTNGSYSSSYFKLVRKWAAEKNRLLLEKKAHS